MDNSFILPSFPVQLVKEVETFMSNLPSVYLKQYGEDYIKKNTPKKQRELAIRTILKQWQAERDHNNFIGKCLKARFGGGGGNPALEAWQKGEISELDYKTIYAIVDHIAAMFCWIQIGWPYIKAAVERFFIDEYHSETQFFFEVLKELMDETFKSCINGKRISVVDWEKNYRQLKQIRWTKFSPNSSIDHAQLQEGASSFKKSLKDVGVEELPLFEIARGICNLAAQNDEPLRHALRDWSIKSAQLYDLLEKGIRTGRKNKTLKSQLWKNGIKHEGIKGGYQIVTNP
jgi:hypothetical protein